MYYLPCVVGNLVWNILKGPVEAIVGVLIGIVMGIILWYVPQKKSVSHVSALNHEYIANDL